MMEMNMEMEEVNCPLCEGSRGELLHQEGSFQMVRCPSCQFIFLNPRPTSEFLLRFYQDYLPENGSSIKAWQRMMEPVFKKAANLIQQHKEKGELLDVGTGFGFFLAEMKKRGWEVVGVEVSQKAMDYARDVLGLTIHPGPLEKVGFSESHFDAVTVFYVIEHLPNPIVFLKECYRILKPGGLLLSSLYDLPAHLSDFSPKMIQRCLEGIGFGKCRHLIGGYTLPSHLGKRVASILFGNLSEAFYYLSLGKILFPGVSKTILAFKEEKI
jgi:SAM-dependent methyltransferase